MNGKVSEIAWELEELPTHDKQQIFTSPTNLPLQENVVWDINNILISKTLLNEKSSNKLIVNISQFIQDEILDDINGIDYFIIIQKN